MRTFSFKSYWNTFKWMMFSNYRDLLTLFAAVILGTAVAEELVTLSIATGDARSMADMKLAVMATFLGFLGSVWMLYGASRTFVDFKTRQSAITLLMHPGTNLEKFFARITYSTVLWAVIGIVGILLGDALRYCFNSILTWNAGTPMLITSFGRLFRVIDLAPYLSKDLAKAVLFVFCPYVWGHSIYVLGSAFFRRNRFLLTSVALCVLQIMLAACFPVLPTVSLFDASASAAEVSFLLIPAAVHYWLAFVIFKRMQVINNKWINV